jgi:small subunit ribosomal protein S6
MGWLLVSIGDQPEGIVMKFYEAVFIVKQDASASYVEEKARTYAKIIKDLGGDVTKTEFCGLKYLSYPIKKNKRGHYVLLNVVSDPNGILETEERLRIDEDILRFLIVRVEKLDNNPSMLMKKAYRDSQEQE